jgi:DNA-binding CsgD family transcriptional regulator
LRPRLLQLTPRERQVFALLAAGYKGAEIGALLFISPKTVKTHIYHIYQKTACRNRVEATRWWQAREEAL